MLSRILNSDQIMKSGLVLSFLRLINLDTASALIACREFYCYLPIALATH